MKKSPENFLNCPIRNVITHLGDKWTILVLMNLHMKGVLRFSEIAKCIPDISQKVLTTTLRKLEDNKLLTRSIYPEVPPRVEYKLTYIGESLIPHISNLIDWAEEHMEEILEDA